jgi:hypothetical protein
MCRLLLKFRVKRAPKSYQNLGEKVESIFRLVVREVVPEEVPVNNENYTVSQSARPVV